MISIAEPEGGQHAVVQFFCPKAQQAEAVKQAVRAATGLDLVVSDCEILQVCINVCLLCQHGYEVCHRSRPCGKRLYVCVKHASMCACCVSMAMKSATGIVLVVKLCANMSLISGLRVVLR